MLLAIAVLELIVTFVEQNFLTCSRAESLFTPTHPDGLHSPRVAVIGSRSSTGGFAMGAGVGMGSSGVGCNLDILVVDGDETIDDDEGNEDGTCD